MAKEKIKAEKFRKINGSVDYNSSQSPVDYYSDIQVDALMQAYSDEVNKKRFSKDDVIDLMVKFYEEVRTASTPFDEIARRYAMEKAEQTLKQLEK